MPKRIFKGQIISDKMQDNVIVSVKISKKHKFYGKDLNLSKNFLANNPINAQVGDSVLIEERSPLSKKVCWTVKEIVESNGGNK